MSQNSRETNHQKLSLTSLIKNGLSIKIRSISRHFKHLEIDNLLKYVSLHTYTLS